MSEAPELKIEILPDEDANVEEATRAEKLEPAVSKTAEPQSTPDATAELQSQFNELKKQADEDKRLRIAAQQEAEAQRREAESARKAQASSHLDTVTTALASAKQEAEAAKQAIRAAKASGDAEAELEAIDRLSAARAQELRLDEARQDIEARQKAPPRRQPPADPVEAFASSRTTESAAWVRSHPDFFRTTTGMRKVTAADAVAQDEGFIPDTPEYFARIEQYLGLREQVKHPAPAREAAPTEAHQVSPPQKPRSAAPPVAPAGAAIADTRSEATVQLRKSEYLAATDGTHVWNYNDPKGKFKKGDPIGVQEFARRKQIMMKSGAYDRSYSEQ